MCDLYTILYKVVATYNVLLFYFILFFCLICLTEKQDEKKRKKTEMGFGHRWSVGKDSSGRQAEREI